MVLSTSHLLIEVLIRALLWGSYVVLDKFEPFVRDLQPEELWLYRYPITQSYVPVLHLWCVIFVIPLIMIATNYTLNGDLNEMKRALLCFTLILGLNGLITALIKIIVGRPRPDFLQRCFPDGVVQTDLKCTGSKSLYLDGRKSFPSGHSSFAFASMSFMSMFLNMKRKFFYPDIHGYETCQIIGIILPLLLAGSISLSRLCDYHHHWEDCCVGSLLGISITYFCFNLYFSHANRTRVFMI